jgi:hypothetical protein
MKRRVGSTLPFQRTTHAFLQKHSIVVPTEPYFAVRLFPLVSGAAKLSKPHPSAVDT